MAVDPGTLTWAVGIGVGTFFSPCGWALIPAYIGYFTATDQDGQEHAGRLGGAMAGARFGAAAGLGILVVLGTAGLAVALARNLWDASSLQLGSGAVAVGLVVGTLLVAMGVLMLLDRSPTVTLPLKAPERKTFGGMVAFGALFALGSVGCTLPVFIGLVAFTLSAAVGAGEGMVAMGAFALTVAGLMVVTSILLSIAREQVLARMRTVVRYAKPVSALLLVAAGLYVIAYYVVFVTV